MLMVVLLLLVVMVVWLMMVLLLLWWWWRKEGLLVGAVEAAALGPGLGCTALGPGLGWAAWGTGASITDASAKEPPPVASAITYREEGRGREGRGGVIKG